MLMVEIIVLPIYSLLYNVNLFNPGLLMVILLGSIGYVAVGTLLAAMAVQARTRDILLPILLFPGSAAGHPGSGQSQHWLPGWQRNGADPSLAEPVDRLRYNILCSRIYGF